jgi:glucosamine-6-phosphate deaminase
MYNWSVFKKMVMENSFMKDALSVHICDDRTELGRLSAKAVYDRMNELFKTKEEINLLFAAAPSQNEFLEALTAYKDIPWQRINAFHMDEYIGLDDNAPQRFGNFLKERIFDLVPFKSVNYIEGNSKELEQECQRYGELLKKYPLDIACTGIGENGHLAFNDPHVANFHDKKMVKIVALDEKSRRQQVNDGCFSHISLVPKSALTLTIPAIIAANYIVCMVPGLTKAEAVRNTLYGKISERCPASVLRLHQAAHLYIDHDSAKLLTGGKIG